MCFLLLDPSNKAKALFTGDNVLGHGTAVFEDLGAYMNSLDKMAEALRGHGGEQIPIYPAHGAVVDDGKAKLKEYIEHRAMRERQIVDVLKSGGEGAWTSMEIVKVVYKDVPEHLHLPAEGGVKQVLRKLEGEGRVAVDGEEKWALKGGSSSL